MRWECLTCRAVGYARRGSVVEFVQAIRRWKSSLMTHNNAAPSVWQSIQVTNHSNRIPPMLSIPLDSCRTGLLSNEPQRTSGSFSISPRMKFGTKLWFPRLLGSHKQHFYPSHKQVSKSSIYHNLKCLSISWIPLLRLRPAPTSSSVSCRAPIASLWILSVLDASKLPLSSVMHRPLYSAVLVILCCASQPVEKLDSLRDAASERRLIKLLTGGFCRVKWKLSGSCCCNLQLKVRPDGQDETELGKIKESDTMVHSSSTIQLEFMNRYSWTFDVSRWWMWRVMNGSNLFHLVFTSLHIVSWPWTS